MPRVTCRCGEALDVPADGPERVVCPKCAARIRVRRAEKAGNVDGFIRFSCPCGRRLKVRARGAPQAGKCPDCGRVVPIPSARGATARARSGPDADTQELSAEDLARLGQWAEERRARAGGAAAAVAGAAEGAPEATPATVKMEAGLRVCPQCRRPVHLSATTCRECGAAVPRR